MNVYSRTDERAIRTHRRVEDWTRSGLLTVEQRDRIVPTLQVDLRRTNRFLRITLFLFGYLIVNAFAGLVGVFAASFSDAIRWLALLAAAGCLALAHWLVRRQKLYHFGVEEAAVIAAGSFFTLFVAQFADSYSTELVLGTATLCAVGMFLRFGYAYAPVAATVLATMFVLDLGRVDTVRRLLAFILLLTIFFVMRERREDHDPEYPADVYSLVQATAWAGIYLVSNFKISEWLSIPDGYQTIYWISYALIWIVPVVGLWFAIRDRLRALLAVNIVAMLITIASNKPYLGVEPKPWDAILFGLMLIGIALAVRRWLASGAGGSRNGFTAERILASEQERIALAGSIASLGPGAPSSTPQEPQFGGGESGGAGASAKF